MVERNDGWSSLDQFLEQRSQDEVDHEASKKLRGNGRIPSSEELMQLMEEHPTAQPELSEELAS